MTEKKLLSLCMITKDDEKYISDCINNIKEIADEIIIADIGSQDKTVETAERAGAVVYKVEWNYNFSEIKNFCMDKANGKWALFLQANEMISGQHLKQIRKLLDNPNAEAYLLYIDYNAKEYGIFSPVQSLRLLRNRKEYRFVFKSFEKIPDDILSNIEDANIQVVCRENVEMTWEFSYRVMLLSEEIPDYPDDGYLQYIYGIMLLNQGKYELSILHLQKAYEKASTEYLYAPHLYKCLSWVYIYLQRYTEALEILDKGIENFSFYTDFLVLRGEIHRQMKQYKEAVRDMEACLNIRERPHFLVPGPEIDDSVVYEALGEIYEETFHFEKAAEQYRQAYKLTDSNDILQKICELEKTYAEQNGFQTMLEIYKCLSDNEKKEDFKQKILGYLLYYNDLDAAEKFICMEEPRLSDDLECVLWSKRRIKNLNEFMTKMQELPAYGRSDTYPVFKAHGKADKALLRFYKNLNIDDAPAELTSAEIHSRIGGYYEKKYKKNMALSAYLRSLMFEPQNEFVKKKVLNYLNEDSEKLLYFLDNTMLITKNAGFKDKQEFKNYILGINAFANCQFEQAVSFFLKVKTRESRKALIHAYIAGSLWLYGKEAEIVSGKYKMTSEFITLFFHICTDGILSRLGEACVKYPDSGIISLEEDRVKSLKKNI